MIATLGINDVNGPSFPTLESFCAIPRKGMNVLSLSLMRKLSLAHFPQLGAFAYNSFVVNPKTHNMLRGVSHDDPGL